jgi:hypothetical protein
MAARESLAASTTRRDLRSGLQIEIQVRVVSRDVQLDSRRILRSNHADDFWIRTVVRLRNHPTSSSGDVGVELNLADRRVVAGETPIAHRSACATPPSDRDEDQVRLRVARERLAANRDRPRDLCGAGARRFSTPESPDCHDRQQDHSQRNLTLKKMRNSKGAARRINPRCRTRPSCSPMPNDRHVSGSISIQ